MSCPYTLPPRQVVILALAFVLMAALTRASEAQWIRHLSPEHQHSNRVLAYPPATVATSEPSTFSQRAFSGLLFSVLSLTAYLAADRNDNPGWAIASYSAGSALGVMILTRRREGAHPIGTVAGAAIGALPGVLAATARSDPEGPGGELGLAFVFFLTAPIGAALGHAWGR